MIKLPPKELDETTLKSLASFQVEYNALPKEKRSDFWKYKRQNDPIKSIVLDALKGMIEPRGACMYCEGTEADQVEHFWPRANYPEVAFAWCNYLYSCGLCNRKKSDQFATETDGGSLVQIRNEAAAERWNRPAFINPR